MPEVLAGRYELEAVIGDGSFSTTYRALDRVLQRTVAVKVLRAVHGDAEAFRLRFEREAVAAARIDHPNVVRVLDFGHDNELTYIVMQLVEGQTLREFIQSQTPVSRPEAIRIVSQILDGLDAVHAAGIVHRDIKPPNIMLTSELDAKVGDFGVAHVSPGPSLTQTGTTLGTAAYMAPEQATGTEVSPQTDLYAVGVILYELVTGKLPFQGESPIQVMYQHVHHEPTPPTHLDPSIDLGLEAVILKALAKDPEDRYSSALEMRDALHDSQQSPIESSGHEARVVSSRVVRVSDPDATAVVPAIAATPGLNRGIWDMAAILLVLSILTLAAFGATALTILNRDDGGFLIDTLAIRRFLSEAESGIPMDPGRVPEEIRQGPRLRLGAEELIAGGGVSVESDRPAAALYAQPSGSSATTLTFDLDDEPSLYVVLLINGMDDEDEDRAPLRIVLNDHVIHEGPAPFLNGRWTSSAWVVDDPDWVRAGGNRLVIENAGDEGGVGEVPWMHLADVTIYAD